MSEERCQLSVSGGERGCLRLDGISGLAHLNLIELIDARMFGNFGIVGDQQCFWFEQRMVPSFVAPPRIVNLAQVDRIGDHLIEQHAISRPAVQLGRVERRIAVRPNRSRRQSVDGQHDRGRRIIWGLRACLFVGGWFGRLHSKVTMVDASSLERSYCYLIVAERCQSEH